METKEKVTNEDLSQLLEIFKVKMKLSELYKQTGPNSSEYLSLSLQLEVLMKEYIDQKINLLPDDWIEA